MKTVIALAALAATVAMPAMAADMDSNMKKMCEKHFSMADTDKNGMLSSAEHAAHAEMMFRQADANSDGMVSLDEMMAMKKKEMSDMDKR
jgi:Ca2+-binding EF-hand superfamily protein